MNSAKTPAQRQREFRARKAQTELVEVRGIFAHPEDHELVKADAAKINRRRARKRSSTTATNPLT